MAKHVVLVTGANRGIGRQVAFELARAGHVVYLGSWDLAKGQQALRDLGAPPNLLPLQLDITDSAHIARAQGRIREEQGRLDILVNNAGINYDTWQQAHNADLEEVEQTIDTNLMGPWRVAKAFIPLMRQQHYGRIVNVSSGAGALTGMRGGTPGYGVSKVALNALTFKLADELHGDGILVNAVCPGWVRIDMGGSAANRSVEKGAETIIWAALLPDNGPTGTFFRDMQEIPH